MQAQAAASRPAATPVQFQLSPLATLCVPSLPALSLQLPLHNDHRLDSHESTICGHRCCGLALPVIHCAGDVALNIWTCHCLQAVFSSFRGASDPATGPTPAEETKGNSVQVQPAAVTWMFKKCLSRTSRVLPPL